MPNSFEKFVRNEYENKYNQGVNFNINGQKNSEIHIKEYLQIIFSRWWIVGIIVFIGVMMGVVKALTSPLIYQAEGSICVIPQETRFSEVQVMTPLNGYSLKSYLITQHQLILSKPLLAKTFHHFKFYKTKVFKKSKQQIKDFRRFFNVEGVRNSFIFNVQFNWTDPELACKVIDFLQKEYIKSIYERRQSITISGLKILKDKAEELKPKVLKLHSQLQRFKNENNMIFSDDSQDLNLEKLREISKIAVTARLERIHYQSRYNDIMKNKNDIIYLQQIPEVINNLAIQKLKVSLSELKQKLNSFTSGRFLGKNHPQIKALRTQIRTVEETIRLELLSILKTIYISYKRSKSKEKELYDFVKVHEKKVIKFNMLKAQYKIMLDNYEIIDKSYTNLCNKIEQVEIVKATGGGKKNIFIASSPTVPAIPISPKKKLILIIAFLLSLTIAITLCFFLEYFDTSIKGKDDLEKLVSVPLLGYIPASSEVNGNLAVQDKKSAVAEAFNTIRTSLTFSLPSNNKHVIAITSPSASDGKSFTSSNLAGSLALNGKKTLIIDADLRRSQLHKVLLLNNTQGISNLLVNDELKLEDVIHKTPIENLDVITAGPHPPNPQYLLELSKMDDIIANLKEKYDYIIFDTPPIGVVSDAIIISNLLDCILLVIKNFTTQKAPLKRAMEISRQGRIDNKILGTILNNVKVPKGRYYYDNYNYGYNYYSDEDDDS